MLCVFRSIQIFCIRRHSITLQRNSSSQKIVIPPYIHKFFFEHSLARSQHIMSASNSAFVIKAKKKNATGEEATILACRTRTAIKVKETTNMGSRARFHIPPISIYLSFPFSHRGYITLFFSISPRSYIGCVQLRVYITERRGIVFGGNLCGRGKVYNIIKYFSARVSVCNPIYSLHCIYVTAD